MKKILHLPTALRWTVFLTLLVFITGCAEWDFFRWLGGDETAPTPRGCKGRTIEEGGMFGPYGYGAWFEPPTGIYPRNMGFAVDEPHFIPITRSDSSN